MKLKSNEPFWLIKNGLLHTYPSLTENLSTDILIIGGGITGSLIAHECIKQGYRTVLTDGREIANGSTAATTSMLQYEIDIPLYQLSEEIGQKGAITSYQACSTAIDNLELLVKQVRSDCGFKRKKSLYFAAYKKDVALLQQEYKARKNAGFKVQWLSETDIKSSYGFHNAYGGILSQQGASMDAFRFAHDILNFNTKKGLLIYDKTLIEKVIYKRNGIIAKTAYDNTIQAKKIIYCNGFESTEIIKEKFVKLLSTYAIVGEASADNYLTISDTLFWNTASPYTYMRTTDDNRLLIGGEDETFAGAAKRDALLKYKSNRLEHKIKKLLPNTDFRTDFAWAGTFGETKDGLPYIGNHNQFPSAYFVLGFGGNGITFSVIGMDMVTAFLKGEKHTLNKYFKFGR